MHGAKGLLWYSIIFTSYQVALYVLLVFLATISPENNPLDVGFFSNVVPFFEISIASWLAVSHFSRKSYWEKASAHVLGLKITLSFALMSFALIVFWGVFVENLSLQYFPVLNFLGLVAIAYISLFSFLYMEGR
jgi:hypothetical protein